MVKNPIERRNAVFNPKKIKGAEKEQEEDNTATAKKNEENIIQGTKN